MALRKSRIERAVATLVEKVCNPCRSNTFVVGLSGGPDSVALVHALIKAGRKHRHRVVAAHLDHGIRAESRQDAEFCADICRRMGVDFEMGAVDVPRLAMSQGCGIEQAARDERYRFLRDIKARTNAIAILVAHTMDDQAETLLMRLIRGSGRLGLASMKAISGDIIRPLLTVSRAEIIEYLEENGVHWREDSSNCDMRFQRNRIRKELLPYIEERFNPRIRETLARTAALLADEEDVLTELGEGAAAISQRREGSGMSVSLDALRKTPIAIARMALRRALAKSGGLRGVKSTHIDRLLDLARSTRSSGKQLSLPGYREAVFSFGEVYLGSGRASRDFGSVELRVPGSVQIDGGRCFCVEECSKDAVSGPSEAVLGVQREDRLEVRTRRPGDRILLNGREMSLRRYFMARCIPADLRDTIPLVTVKNRVLWIPGVMRPSPGEGGRFVRVTAQGIATLDPTGADKRRTA